MASLTNVRCVLAVKDLPTSVAFYRDALGFTLSVKDVTRIQEVADKPWGMREFGVRAPDGHRIMFGQRISA
jgi:uncharacterized glyoxalase superfamily protein PhnB